MSFELCEDVSEEESEKESDGDNITYVEDNNFTSKSNIRNDTCFIIFWENISSLFKHC